MNGAVNVGRILDRADVLDHVGIDASEPFDELHRLAVPDVADVGLVSQVRGLDDQRVAFPVASRVAEVLPNVVVRMWSAVELDDSGLVNHFVRDRESVRALRDVDAVAVARR